jgi:hypothetical protein
MHGRNGNSNGKKGGQFFTIMFWEAREEGSVGKREPPCYA